jgi:hypothetical protein
MVDYNLTIENHIYSSTTKLWSNKKQGILQILIMQLMRNPNYFNSKLRPNILALNVFPLFKPFFSLSFQYI